MRPAWLRGHPRTLPPRFERMSAPHTAPSHAMTEADASADKPDYRSTLNLPDTSFPMRGDLPRREPG